MSKLKCTKCNGRLKSADKVIKAIIPEREYKITKVELHKCKDCKKHIYVTLEGEDG